MDVEGAHSVHGKTGFDKLLAVLVGTLALLAALLATLQQDAGRREERALILGARLSVDIFEGTAGAAQFRAFRANAIREASLRGVEAAQRGTAALGRPGEADAVLVLADAHLSAGPRLIALAREMARAPKPEDGVHPHTAAVAGSSLARLTSIVEAQGEQVDAADRYGERGNLTVLALSLLAIGAALVALAGISGRGRVGWASAAASGFMVTASIGCGAAALLG